MNKFIAFHVKKTYFFQRFLSPVCIDSTFIFYSKTPHTITNLNDSITMDGTIARSMNDNINMDGTIAGSMNDNINMDGTIAGSMNVRS